MGGSAITKPQEKSEVSTIYGQLTALDDCFLTKIKNAWEQELGVDLIQVGGQVHLTGHTRALYVHD